MAAFLIPHVDVRMRGTQVSSLLWWNLERLLRKPYMADFPSLLPIQELEDVVLNLLEDLKGGAEPGYFFFTPGNGESPPTYVRFKGLSEYHRESQVIFDREAENPGAYAEQLVGYALFGHYYCWAQHGKDKAVVFDYLRLRAWLRDHPKDRGSLAQLLQQVDRISLLHFDPKSLDCGGSGPFLEDLVKWKKQQVKLGL